MISITFGVVMVLTGVGVGARTEGYALFPYLVLMPGLMLLRPFLHGPSSYALPALMTISIIFFSLVAYLFIWILENL